ncbi:hypothetical protein EGW08_002665 [Elysia chlorotica]|uniref:Uncharacterized protein n=1 Tax=Elysia chlorotica TaxID=188477 RepID=A0A3S1BRA6_ELYCH|nr:hypothetical protein EGW08_002665 [Elysia chlorotica]
MGPRTPLFLLALWTLIGFPEPSSACQYSPTCLQAYKGERSLKDAVDRNDRETVCEILPAKIHCIQLAVNACADDMSSSPEQLEKLQDLVTEMEGRYERTCPGYPAYSVPRNSSPDGISLNSRGHLTAVAATFVSLVLSQGFRLSRHLAWLGT